MVDGCLRDQRQRDTGRIRIDHRRALALERFIAFDAALVLVAGLAFLEHQLGAANAAVAVVQHGEVIVHAVCDRSTRIGKGTGAIGQERYESALLCKPRRGQK